MKPNDYYLVCLDKNQKVNHMITLEQWRRGDRVACGKRYKIASHSKYNTTRLLERKRCPACFVLVCMMED